MIGEREVNIAAKMYESRRLVKALMGPDAFKEKVDGFRPLLQALCEKDGLSEMGALFTLLKEVEGDGMLSLLTMAACTEIMEPSDA